MLNHETHQCADRGLLLGHAVFETLRIKNHRLLFFNDHWNRLAKSAQYLNIDLPFNKKVCEDILYSQINKILGACTHAGIRLTITAGNAQRGLTSKAKQANYYVSCFTLNNKHEHSTLATTSIRKNQHSPTTRIKTTNYLDNILARSEAKAKQTDYALLLNLDNKVAECCVANIFCIKNKQMYTPAADQGIIPGITRAKICHIADNLNIPLHFGSYELDFFLQADEVFITNALIGVVSIKKIDYHQFYKFGITNTIKQQYEQLAT